MALVIVAALSALLVLWNPVRHKVETPTEEQEQPSTPGETAKAEETFEEEKGEVSEAVEEVEETGEGGDHVGIPIYPGAVKIELPEEAWSHLGISPEAVREGYQVDASVEEVVDWYASEAADWEVMDARNFTGMENDTIYYRLYRSGDVGLLIFISPSRMPFKGALIQVAYGNWSLFENYTLPIPGGERPPEEAPEERPPEEEVFQLFYEFPELGEGPVTFKICPMRLEDISIVEPLGNLNPEAGHTFPSDHGGLGFANPNKYPPLYIVRAPADGIIVEIEWRVQDWPPESGFTGKYNDYKVVIAHTSTFMSALDHISELDDSILERAGNLTVGFNRVEIPIKEGEIIGRAGGRPKAQMGLDWIVYDKSVTHFIHPEKYERSAYAAHFLEYCDEELRAKLMAKLKRTAEPRWGQFDYDQPGRLVGNWFHINVSKSDPLGDWDKHLAFVYYMYDPKSIRIAVGGTLPMKVATYSVVGNAPDPAEVTPETGKVVYWLDTPPEYGVEKHPKYTMIVEMLDEETIRVQVFKGWIEDPEFTDDAQIYTR